MQNEIEQRLAATLASDPRAREHFENLQKMGKEDPIPTLVTTVLSEILADFDIEAYVRYKCLVSDFLSGNPDKEHFSNRITIQDFKDSGRMVDAMAQHYLGVMHFYMGFFGFADHLMNDDGVEDEEGVKEIEEMLLTYIYASLPEFERVHGKTLGIN
jgi:hypothetical protein